MTLLHRITPRQVQVRAWAWLLVLAMLLAALWGQVHRVLHTGGLPHQTVSASADHSGKAAVAGLADEDGSSLCQLLDQLALGAGATATAATALHTPAKTAPAWPSWQRLFAIELRPYAARGPPRNT